MVRSLWHEYRIHIHYTGSCNVFGLCAYQQEGWVQSHSTEKLELCTCKLYTHKLSHTCIHTNKATLTPARSCTQHYIISGDEVPCHGVTLQQESWSRCQLVLSRSTNYTVTSHWRAVEIRWGKNTNSLCFLGQEVNELFQILRSD